MLLGKGQLKEIHDWELPLVIWLCRHVTDLLDEALKRIEYVIIVENQ